MYTLAAFFRYCSATLQSPSLKITTRCHSVFSLRSPVALSRQVSEVAMLKLAIGRPSWVRRISGSLPRFPTRITLFTLPAIAALHSRQLLASISESAGAAPYWPKLRRLRIPPWKSEFLGITLNRPYTLTGPAIPLDPRLSTYSSPTSNVPVLFQKFRGCRYDDILPDLLIGGYRF